VTTEAKTSLDGKIKAMVGASSPHRFIARRLFLYDFAEVFKQNEDRGFQILNEICEKFKLPFSTIRVVGSAQTGYSYYSKRDFIPGQSDLDVAIISSSLFQDYSQQIYWLTNRYADETKFRRIDGISVVQDFRNYLSSGWFRPDLMPEGALKTDWISFFNRLSNKHADLFGNINAGVFLSEGFFEMKNSAIVQKYKAQL
jgi:hypothetical protein